MEVMVENTKDEAMLSRIDLGLLDAGSAPGNEELAKSIGRHNDKVLALENRFQKLVTDRTNFNVDAWSQATAAAISDENLRLLHECWDALVDLESVVRDRAALLSGLEVEVADRMSANIAEREELIEAATKSLAKEHRGYLKANPSRAGSWLAQMASESPEVVVIDQEFAALKAARENHLTAVRKCQEQLSAVRNRKREVFGLISD
jgi:hypothetical protein